MCPYFLGQRPPHQNVCGGAAATISRCHLTLDCGSSVSFSLASFHLMLVYIKGSSPGTHKLYVKCTSAESPSPTLCDCRTPQMAGNRGFSSSSPDSLATPSRSQFVHRSTRHLPTPSPGESECDTLEYLNITERWWRAHQPWLEQCGYLLREKYRHDWIPSWKKGGFFSKLHTPEDMIELPVRRGA